MRPSFDDVFAGLQDGGPARVTSSRGTVYTVSAEVASDGTKTIVGRPRSSQVRIHANCWADDLRCKRTRAGGIYNGSPSIFDWYASRVSRKAR